MRARERWLKANFHAHSRAWDGLTNGRRSTAETVRRYHALGYDIAGVSNYQSIADRGQDSSDVPVYEQGYGPSKTHFIVIGARRVDWLDYPLLESTDAKQRRIDGLVGGAGGDSTFVVIAHPELRGAFSTRDLRRLTGYDAIEVDSHFGNAEALWDTALSAGRLVWGVGGDDSHDAADPEQAGHVWTMVQSSSTRTVDVIRALRAGDSYAAMSRVGGGQADVALESLTTHGDTVDLRVSGAPATVWFIGAEGRVLESFENTHGARFVLPPGEPYVRAVVETRDTRLVFNPIVRTSAGRPTTARATERRQSLLPWLFLASLLA